MAPGLVPVTVTGSTVGALFEVRPGQAYLLSEVGPAGYTPVSIVCTVENLAPRLTTTITLNGSELAVCVFINDDQPGQLTLVKEVDNGTTGATATATDWTLSASGPTPISGTSGSVTVTNAEVNAGTYTLAESGGPSGYQPSSWSCTGATASGATVAVPSGGDVTCTITTRRSAPRLTLVKQVENGTTGGTADADRLDVVRDGAHDDQRPVRHAAVTNARSLSARTPWRSPGGRRATRRRPGHASVPTWWRFDPAHHRPAGDMHHRQYGGRPGVTLVKQVTNGSGGLAVPTDRLLSAAGGGDGSGPCR